ncbi:hypothetical protein RFI_05749 [Reticulomyxa filosa]|uniref:t-SNARE coiled-coil homology domain-containing protein n=1 Tax=Reticulomyxa filosa TaxID=46433 RepID=X6NZT8_RETFI|nr:hypothetical protein RFI_05749 [Reticulomyxa filosa]|eukprot:ETO31368.1 hypothetical protein RFI_05749 [Reticulomyxa filosa]
MSKGKNNGTIRQLNLLLREVEIVEQNCGTSKPKKDGNQLDDFQQNKAELNILMKTIKDNIQTRKNLEERTGESKEAIEMKYQIENDFKRAQELHSKMSQAYEGDIKKFEKQKAGALAQPDLDERKELLGLFKQFVISYDCFVWFFVQILDLEYTESEFKPKKTRGGGFQIAQNARQKRQKQREDGTMSQDAIPLTQQQQAFIQESVERDQLLDQKLDVILQGVKQLGMIAYDINEELVKQEVMLDEIENKMDKLQDKLETRNEQMKKLLEAVSFFSTMFFKKKSHETNETMNFMFDLFCFLFAWTQLLKHPWI